MKLHPWDSNWKFCNHKTLSLEIQTGQFHDHETSSLEMQTGQFCNHEASSLIWTGQFSKDDSPSLDIWTGHFFKSFELAIFLSHLLCVHLQKHSHFMSVTVLLYLLAEIHVNFMVSLEATELMTAHSCTSTHDTNIAVQIRVLEEIVYVTYPDLRKVS